MLILRIFRKVQKFEKLHCSNYIKKRFLSVENEPLSKVTEVGRKYLKPLKNSELKPSVDDYSRNLFAGTLNKKIFEYPAVLSESDIHIAINHAAELERFLIDNSNAQLSEETLNELRKLEVFGLTVPQKYGGAGYNETECTFLRECSGINPTIGRFLGYNENYGSKILNEFGTEEQKEKYLPRLAQGKSCISLAFLENGPIIDLSKIEGHAINDELKKQFILNAEKKWVHNADKTDLFLVMVKLAELLDEDAAVKVGLSFFIVDKNAPGVTVSKLLPKYAQENNVFDVSLKEVVVSHENLLGSKETDGYLVLKKALSYNNVTDAAICSHIIKQIIHNVIEFIKEKSLSDKSFKGNVLIQENLTLMSIYTYALESALYLLTGRFDSFDNPDLFNESIFVKALAVDFLHIVIKKYTEILGRESLKSSGLLELAINTVQYYSVFDENIQYLKILTAAEGLVHSAGLLSSRIKRLRKPLENPSLVLKSLFSSGSQDNKIQKKFNYKLEVHECLSTAADLLEENVIRFQTGLEDLFTSYGSLAMNNEHVILKLADAAAYIYSFIACISRASSAICYDFPNYDRERILALAYAHIADTKIKGLCFDSFKDPLLTDYCEKIGNITFSQKQYPAEHPLSRTH